MSGHVELTEKSVINMDGVRVHRIRATKDIPDLAVKKGDLGGWVESLDNVQDEAWVDRNGMVYGNARMYGHSMVSSFGRVYGDARLYDRSLVAHSGMVYDNAVLRGRGSVMYGGRLFGDACVYDEAMVCNEAMVYGTTQVFDTACVNSGEWYGDAWIGGNMLFDKCDSNIDIDGIFIDKEGHLNHLAC